MNAPRNLCPQLTQRLFSKLRLRRSCKRTTRKRIRLLFTSLWRHTRRSPRTRRYCARTRFCSYLLVVLCCKVLCSLVLLSYLSRAGRGKGTLKQEGIGQKGFSPLSICLTRRSAAIQSVDGMQAYILKCTICLAGLILAGRWGRVLVEDS